MPWLSCLIQFFALQVACPILDIWTKLTTLAPVFSAVAALSNFALAIYIFGYTRKKNTADTQIKWFLELVYSPNKEAFNSYFKNLSSLKEKFFPGNDPLSEQQKIDSMKFINDEQNKFRNEFAEILRHITPDIYKQIIESIDNLTDKLLKTFDNDELKLENQKTYSREIIGCIMDYKGKIIKSIFSYKG